MSPSQDELTQMQRLTDEFLELVRSCNQADLIQCMKLLAMYLAMYKQRFGEIPATFYQAKLESSALDENLAQIVNNGMEEASEMLRIVLRRTHKQPENNAGVNYIN